LILGYKDGRCVDNENKGLQFTRMVCAVVKS
jgi:hypothetical protein